MIKHEDNLCIFFTDENGFYHNDNGPAYRSKISNLKFWKIHGINHRLDGPAAEYSDGKKEWHLNGVRILVNSQEEFERYLKLLVFI